MHVANKIMHKKLLLRKTVTQFIVYCLTIVRQSGCLKMYILRQPLNTEYILFNFGFNAGHYKTEIRDSVEANEHIFIYLLLFGQGNT